MSNINLEPSAVNCYNGYVYDPTCDECATKGLAGTKECYERRTSLKERRERCAECEFKEYTNPFTNSDDLAGDYCKIIGTACDDINSCDTWLEDWKRVAKEQDKHAD